MTPTFYFDKVDDMSAHNDIDDLLVPTPPTQGEALSLIAGEIRSTKAKIHNAIANRREHPTYGYRKADIVADLNFMEGLLYSHAAMRLGQRSAAHALQAQEEATHLGIDLTLLRKQVQSA